MVNGRTIRVAFYGLGPIGVQTMRIAAGRPYVQIVGAIDTDPAKAGASIRALTGLENAPDIAVSPTAGDVLGHAKPDVVVHCTGSVLAAVLPQLREIAAAGASIVSSCEELMYPWKRQPALAREIDEAGRAAEVAILGTGVNPGFAMDLLPLVLSEVAAQINAVRITRVVDASLRRGPLQRKIGAGLTRDEFERRAREGTMGHVGLPESLDMVAAGLGWDLQGTEDTLEPVLADSPIETPHVSVAEGAVAGIHQVAQGRTVEGRELSLQLDMYLGAPSPRDEIVIDGDPELNLVVRHGIFGDTATAAILANAIPAVHAAQPGLRTMLDMPPMPARA